MLCFAGLLEAAAALAPAGSAHLEATLSFLEELPRSSILPGGILHAAVSGDSLHSEPLEL